MSVNRHLVGLLLGAEEDWPQAFEAIAGRLDVFRYEGVDHVLDTERVRIHPFNLRDPARHQVVIDRLAYWYYHPREWLKKVALMDDAYLMNSPFTFQSMEKHSAYCALIRLGMNVLQPMLSSWTSLSTPTCRSRSLANRRNSQFVQQKTPTSSHPQVIAIGPP